MKDSLLRLLQLIMFDVGVYLLGVRPFINMVVLIPMNITFQLWLDLVPVPLHLLWVYSCSAAELKFNTQVCICFHAAERSLYAGQQ